MGGRSREGFGGPGKTPCRICHPNFLPKVYDVKISVYTEEGALYLLEPTMAGRLKIHGEGLLKAVPSDGPYALGHLMNGGIVYCPYEWDLSKA